MLDPCAAVLGDKHILMSGKGVAIQSPGRGAPDIDIANGVQAHANGLGITTRNAELPDEEQIPGAIVFGQEEVIRCP